jgi:lipid II:glycine glycyltransferase (peptidoglycan interpeptide bridge formation enzyme)
MLDLRPRLEDIFRGLHPDCIRRKIRRAGRENLTSEAGRSDALLDDFFAIQVTTRKRHGLPPQPRQWFRNLLEAIGDRATIRVARSQGRVVAAILTLRHKQTLVYKYGGSRVEDNNLGSKQLLLWETIEDAKAAGVQELDLGRWFRLEAVGLAKFKERWGARRQELDYFRYPLSKPRKVYHRMLRGLPKPALIAAGRLLYRHMA